MNHKIIKVALCFRVLDIAPLEGEINPHITFEEIDEFSRVDKVYI